MWFDLSTHHLHVDFSGPESFHWCNISAVLAEAKDSLVCMYDNWQGCSRDVGVYCILGHPVLSLVSDTGKWVRTLLFMNCAIYELSLGSDISPTYTHNIEQSKTILGCSKLLLFCVYTAVGPLSVAWNDLKRQSWCASS